MTIASGEMQFKQQSLNAEGEWRSRIKYKITKF